MANSNVWQFGKFSEIVQCLRHKFKDIVQCLSHIQWSRSIPNTQIQWHCAMPKSYIQWSRSMPKTKFSEIDKFLIYTFCEIGEFLRHKFSEIDEFLRHKFSKSTNFQDTSAGWSIEGDQQVQEDKVRTWKKFIGLENWNLKGSCESRERESKIETNETRRKKSWKKFFEAADWVGSSADGSVSVTC